MRLAMAMSAKLIFKTSPFVVAPPSSWHTKGMDYHSFHCTNWDLLLHSLQHCLLQWARHDSPNSSVFSCCWTSIASVTTCVISPFFPIPCSTITNVLPSTFTITTITSTGWTHSWTCFWSHCNIVGDSSWVNLFILFMCRLSFRLLMELIFWLQKFRVIHAEMFMHVTKSIWKR